MTSPYLDKHRDKLDAAVAASASREYYSAYDESPSPRVYGESAAGELRPLEVDRPIRLEAEYENAGEADYAAIVPGCERYGDRGVRVITDDPITAYRAFLAGVRIATNASGG